MGKIYSNETIIDALTEIAIQEEYNENYFKYIAIILTKTYNADSIKISIENNTIINYEKKDNSEKKNFHIIKIPYTNSGKIVITNLNTKIDSNLELTIANLIGIILNNKKIAENRNKEIEELQIDPLTGLQSRTLYEKRVKNFNEEKVGICYIDANYLKTLNDNYGHDMGDKLLKAIAACIKKTFRDKDSYRIGGDEIIIIAGGIGKDLFYKKINTLISLIQIEKEKLLAKEGISQKEILGELITYGSTYKEKVDNIIEAINEADLIMIKNKNIFHKNFHIKR